MAENKDLSIPTRKTLVQKIEDYDFWKTIDRKTAGKVPYLGYRENGTYYLAPSCELESSGTFRFDRTEKYSLETVIGNGKDTIFYLYIMPYYADSAVKKGTMICLLFNKELGDEECLKIAKSYLDAKIDDCLRNDASIYVPEEHLRYGGFAIYGGVSIEEDTLSLIGTAS